MMGDNAATVTVSYEALKAALGIPHEADLVAIIQAPENVLDQTVMLVFKHPNLPARWEGAIPIALRTPEELAEMVRDDG